jgi:hypothetical protein
LGSVLVLAVDGSLEPWRLTEAERILAGVLEPVEEAATILDRVACLSGDQTGELPPVPNLTCCRVTRARRAQALFLRLATLSSDGAIQ